MSMNERSINVGEHRGKGRVWLEGNWLIDAGFARGTWYNVTVEPGTIVFQANPNNGARKVSGKGERPIIDMNTEALKGFIGACVLSFPRKGRMILRKA